MCSADAVRVVSDGIGAVSGLFMDALSAPVGGDVCGGVVEDEVDGCDAHFVGAHFFISAQCHGAHVGHRNFCCVHKTIVCAVVSNSIDVEGA